jgi:hypothetical protein
MATGIVPLYSQTTLELCWEACGRMVWHWKYKSLKGYEGKAKNYLKFGRGLSPEETNRFYKQLGMRSLQKPTGSNLRHALGWSPVIFAWTDSPSDKFIHAVVASDFKKDHYQILNPCITAVLSFDDEENASGSCSAGRKMIPAATIDKSLGAYIWYW